MLRALLFALIVATPAGAFQLDGEGGGVTLEETPGSVAALTWGLAEAAVDLGLPLTGVADIEGYRTWVGAPVLPDGLTDLGLRQEPNLEALSTLSPDLILGAGQQAGLARQLGTLAPTVITDEFSADHDNAEAARATYLRLAGAFEKTDLAERRLAEIDARMVEAGDRVRAAWNGNVPPVLPVRLLTRTAVRIHGPNSTAEAALKGMGLTPAASGGPTEWGFVLAPVEELADYPDAAIVHFDPFADKDTLFASPLWQAIPAVAAGRFAVAPTAWTFGGVVSLGVLSDHIAEALVRMAEDAR